MAYIGKSPVIGNFVKLDAISVVNGQAAYTMQNGGSNFTDYESVNQFLVSLNGTIQAPTDSFTVSGSTLTFASNLSTGDVIDFIVVFGNSLSAGVPSDATVTTAKLADSAVTAAKITDSTITAAKLASGTVQNQSAFKNIIINGDMSIAQRATSKSALGTGFNTVDRFETLKNLDAVFTESQSTDVPSGQGFSNSWKIECTTADASPDADYYLSWRQPIEAQMLKHLKYGTSSAESTTLSFWIKSSKTGTYVVILRNIDNSRLISQTYTISSADTWEKKELTFAGDTSSGFNNDNGEGLRVQFQLVAGSDYTSGTLQTTWGTYANANSAAGQLNFGDSTSNNLYITGVQFEVGTAASDFEFLPFDVNLKRCERYYQKSFAYGTAPADDLQKFEYHSIQPYSGASMAGLISYYKTEMRTIPTVTVYTSGQGGSSGTGKISWYNGSGWGNASVSVASNSTEKFFHLNGSSFTSMKLAQFNYEATAEL